jgi:hypothetical protein
MLSELKQRKMARVFKVLDGDRNNFVDWADLERIVRRLTEAKGLEAGSSEFNAIWDRYMAYWQNIQQGADTNHDQRISLEEWMAAHTALLSSNAEVNYEAFIKPLVEVILEAVDLDNDGRNTRDDYRLFYKIYDIEDSPEEWMVRFFPPEKASLSRGEVEALVREFYLSEEETEPGNWVFGPF